ncbi:MAG: family 43 glycosylhydrolase [Alphaproteobacteria bacterium]|nr:family 43 glycosylhydrolase [Alphaproteobacteria bacterium]
MLRMRLAVAVLAFGMVAGCVSRGHPQPESGPGEASASAARFEWIRYEGSDPVYKSLSRGENDYLNPILAGFYPDPSITRAGDKFYLVNSTFCYFPGIPVFESSDLVHWRQIANVIDRPGMLKFAGLPLSRCVFAPTIRYHAGRFIVVNTCVDCGGNYVSTAADPAGPWSDPIWIPAVGGVDPSLFFDADGRAYLVNSDAPAGKPRYDGHRAIWIREIDPQSFQPISKPVVLVDGGVHPEQNPIWIEGPHIYRRDGWYYLMAAEGGTAEGHSEVVFRARNVLGPYQAYAGDPILTQRNLPEDRRYPITSTGHADLVEDQNGRWWAVFLGVRPYEADYYNTGRETFLLPVQWRNGWPVILESGRAVPYSAPRPDLPPDTKATPPTSGDFIFEDSFDAGSLAPRWISLRDSNRTWARTRHGALALRLRPERLGEPGAAPSFIGIRQQHPFATVTTLMNFNPARKGDEAGLAVLQNDDFFYAFEVAKVDADRVVIRLRRKAGDAPAAVIASARIYSAAPVYLRIKARGGFYDFEYALKKNAWRALARDVDGKILSTHSAGGFVGAVFGLFAERLR